jgi:hypothetical protein
VFQEDLKFYLAGYTVQLKDDISQKESGVTMEPIDCARFISLSDYSLVDLIHPTYSGVVMGLSNEKNVAILFSKVSKRIYQNINRNAWDKARETICCLHQYDWQKIVRHSLNICVIQKLYGSAWDYIRSLLFVAQHTRRH